MTSTDFLETQVPDLAFSQGLPIDKLDIKPHYAWYVSYDGEILMDYEEAKAVAEAENTPDSVIPVLTISEMITELTKDSNYILEFQYCQLCNFMAVQWSKVQEDWSLETHHEKLANALVNLLKKVVQYREDHIEDQKA